MVTTSSSQHSRPYLLSHRPQSYHLFFRHSTTFSVPVLVPEAPTPPPPPPPLPPPPAPRPPAPPTPHPLRACPLAVGTAFPKVTPLQLVWKRAPNPKKGPQVPKLCKTHLPLTSDPASACFENGRGQGRGREKPIGVNPPEQDAPCGWVGNPAEPVQVGTEERHMTEKIK